MSAALCDEIRARRVLGRAEPADAAHLAACAECRGETATVGRLAAAFGAYEIPAPDPRLAASVATAVRPVLAARRRYAARRALASAVAAALLPLPLILVVDAWALQAIYHGLARLLPPTLSFYLVLNYAAVLALLGALTYGAIPLLAERQARNRHEASYG